MGFLEGNIAEEKVFGGKVFPKTLLPADTCHLAEVVRSERAQLSELLQQHGAVLFRGFNIASPEDFSRVVEAFGWDEMPYTGPVARVKRAERVYTANEAPVDKPIGFHHEMALLKQFPSKIFFCCLQPSPEGGQTSILPSHIIVQKMEELAPEFVLKLEQDGFLYRVKISGNPDPSRIMNSSWQQMFKTDDQKEAEKRAKEKIACDSVKFNEDGSADLLFGPMNPIMELGGKRVWFKSIVGYVDQDQDVGASFGDGISFPAAPVHAYQKILDDNCVDVSWDKGDVLLIDNLTVQHARRSGKPPRVVLVSVCT